MRSERDAESSGGVSDDDFADPLDSAADAATIALRDAEAAAESAADTNLAAGEAATATAEVARQASVATATAVAAAASSTAQLAAQTAAAVEAEAVNRAADVAMSAENARDTIAGALPDDADRDDASRAAHAVAVTVAADVVARSMATESAAALVAAAVTTAANTAFVAARSAAATVELAADMAAASGRVVAASSGVTEVATNVAVRSATQVADLAPRLRAVAALRRVRLAPNPLVAELTGALARAELRLHYQPIYNMQTGALTAVEALLRWQHPLRGLLTPAVFLKLAESHPDLVTPVGDWVLATAVAEAQTWRRSLGAAAPKMWVNISCDQLGTGHLPALVERLLSTAGLAPSALGMEVTERQLVVIAGEAGHDLLDLRDLGVSLAVDDFGTGYASLDYLRLQIFDEIKIDRSFVAGLGEDRTDTAVTSSIIALAQSLDLNVVAEGVETQDQYDRLKELGCAMCQGYFLHRPASPTVVGRLLGVLPDGDSGSELDAGRPTSTEA
jgi:EAL domain-containing protein (putative c-di-GMP-specific phosphodiesterase class I)